jgi:hypothetical protein
MKQPAVIGPVTCLTRGNGDGKEGFMKTAEPVRELALYASACCSEELLFLVNDQFCRCPKCGSLCFWKLIEPVVSWEDMDVFGLEAA